MNTDEDETMDNHTKPIGVFVTIRDIHQSVLDIKDLLNSEVDTIKGTIASLKAQLAALYVVQGIQVAVFIFLIQKGIGQ